MTKQILKTHLFGEMDLDLTKNTDQIYKAAFYVAEQVGDFLNWDNKEKILYIYGSDLEQVKIHFKNDRVFKVLRSVDEGKNWEELSFNENMFEVTKKTLINYKNKIKFGREKSLPLMQGEMINLLIKKYKIPACFKSVKWGYHLDLVGIETKKQFMIWRDCGSHAEFLGLINKDGSDFK